MILQGAKSIKNLVENVKQYIPSNLHAETILSLRGTAGLRLLMKEKPEETKKLLDVVRTELDKCGFAIANNAVDILTGSDEGIYSWFTVNYLLGKIIEFIFVNKFNLIEHIFDFFSLFLYFFLFNSFII